MASTRTDASAAASEAAEARLMKWSMSSDCFCSMSIFDSEEGIRVFGRGKSIRLRGKKVKSRTLELGFRLRGFVEIL